MLKLQYFGHLMQRADSLEKDPDAGTDWRPKEKEVTEDVIDSITYSMDMKLSKPGDCGGEESAML